MCEQAARERKKKKPRMPHRAGRAELNSELALADLEPQVPVRKHRLWHSERGPEWDTSHCRVLQSEPAEPGSDLTPFWLSTLGQSPLFKWKCQDYLTGLLKGVHVWGNTWHTGGSLKINPNLERQWVMCPKNNCPAWPTTTFIKHSCYDVSMT